MARSAAEAFTAATGGFKTNRHLIVDRAAARHIVDVVFRIASDADDMEGPGTVIFDQALNCRRGRLARRSILPVQLAISDGGEKSPRVSLAATRLSRTFSGRAPSSVERRSASWRTNHDSDKGRHGNELCNTHERFSFDGRPDPGASRHAGWDTSPLDRYCEAQEQCRAPGAPMTAPSTLVSLGLA